MSKYCHNRDTCKEIIKMHKAKKISLKMIFPALCNFCKVRDKKNCGNLKLIGGK